MSDLPKPYYEEPGITIYHGDCRDILPYLDPVDLVLTDPPYGIGEDGGQKNRWRNGDGRNKCPIPKYEKMNWDLLRPDKELFEIVKKASDNLAIFGANYFSDYLEPSAGWLFWDKNIGGDFSDGELIYTNFLNSIRKHTVHPFKNLNGGKSREHPTQKPIEILIWCINLCPSNPKIVLDPFMGSGTTLRAAKDLDRKAIGIEIEEKYCEIATKRLQQEVFNFSLNSKEA